MRYRGSTYSHRLTPTCFARLRTWPPLPTSPPQEGHVCFSLGGCQLSGFIAGQVHQIFGSPPVLLCARSCPPPPMLLDIPVCQFHCAGPQGLKPDQRLEPPAPQGQLVPLQAPMAVDPDSPPPPDPIQFTRSLCAR